MAERAVSNELINATRIAGTAEQFGDPIEPFQQSDSTECKMMPSAVTWTRGSTLEPCLPLRVAAEHGEVEVPLTLSDRRKKAVVDDRGERQRHCQLLARA
jgi:hypothetical protein